MTRMHRLIEAARYVRDRGLVIVDSVDWVDNQLGRLNDSNEHPGLSCRDAQEIIDHYRARDRFIRGIPDPDTEGPDND